MINYFGTDTRTAGHYLWELRGESMISNGLNGFKSLPFNPEDFTKIPGRNYDYKPKGSIEFHKIEGWSIFAIAGSPIDGRGGCKSVFFWKEDLTQDQIVERIKSIPAAMKIINQMPFPVEIFKPAPIEQA